MHGIVTTHVRRHAETLMALDHIEVQNPFAIQDPEIDGLAHVCGKGFHGGTGNVAQSASRQKCGADRQETGPWQIDPLAGIFGNVPAGGESGQNSVG